jgi:hypothetical protein
LDFFDDARFLLLPGIAIALGLQRETFRCAPTRAKVPAVLVVER